MINKEEFCNAKKITSLIIGTVATSFLLTPYSVSASQKLQSKEQNITVSERFTDKLLKDVQNKHNQVEQALNKGNVEGLDINKILDEATATLNYIQMYESSSIITPQADPDEGSIQEITNIFKEQMRGNGLRMLYMYPNDLAGAGLYFASQVKSGGPWDYKLKYGVSKRYKFNSRIITGEDIGNIHYGYVGRYLFPASILKSVAGAYQIYSGTAHPSWFKTYFDDPQDQAMIEWGISMFNTDNK